MNVRHTPGLFVLLTLAIAGAARAQTFEVDALALLTDSQVQPQTFTDGVWTLTPPQGRTLFLLPIRVPTGVREPLGLEKISAKVAGGQFVGWLIPRASNDASPYGGARGGGLAGQPFGAPGGNGSADMNYPRLTRVAELKPDGTISWKLLRGVPGGSFKDPKQIYAMAIDRRLLPPAPRQQAGKEAEYRQQVDAHRRLLTVLKDLPDEFTEPAPQLVYSVYYVPATLSRLVFSGDDPLPWQGTFELLTELRNLSGRSFDPKAAHPVLSDLLKDDNKFSMRLAASVLAANSNISRVDPNSLLVPLIEKLISEGGVETRRILITAVTDSSSATPVAGLLLDRVMNDSDATVVLTAMRARVKDSERQRAPLDSEALRRFADAATRLLADPEGPPPAAVLATVSDLAKLHADNLNGLAEGVSFGPVPPDRHAALVTTVLAAARQRDAFAVRLLDKQLLNPNTPRLAAIALQQIATTPLGTRIASGPDAGPYGDPNQTQPEPQRRSALGFAFDVAERLAGRGEPEQPPAPAAPPLPGGPGVAFPVGPGAQVPTRIAGPGSAQGARQAVADQLYPLDSPRHNLMRLLSDGDEALRSLAWQALPRFVVSSGDSRATGQGIKETCVALADAAAAVDPSPVQVVTFLQEQSDRGAVTSAMQRLLAKANGPARMSAMLYVAAAGPSPLGQALGDMTGDERAAVAALWYSTVASTEQQQSGMPLVVGLLRGDQGANASGRLTQWFAQQVAASVRPRPSEWAAAVGSEDTLVVGLIDTDDAYAMGCAAALIGTILPPDELAVQDLHATAARFKSEAPDKEEARKLIRLEWPVFREQLITERLAAASGKYNLTIRVAPPLNSEKLPDPEKRRPMRHELGEVDVAFEGSKKVTISPKLDAVVIDKPLGVRIPNPAQLAEFPAAKEQSLKDRGELPSIAVELTLDNRRRWVGTATLPDRRTATVVLTPQ